MALIGLEPVYASLDWGKGSMKCCGTTGLLLVILLVSDHMSHAQHWSYGLRPGGKRDAESLQDAYGEVPNEVSLFTEPQRLECSNLQNRLNLLRGALINWLEGDNARKKI
ncbi:progonadoliberin-1 [Gastrophryne carolinensis]